MKIKYIKMSNKKHGKKDVEPKKQQKNQFTDWSRDWGESNSVWVNPTDGYSMYDDKNTWVAGKSDKKSDSKKKPRKGFKKKKKGKSFKKNLPKSLTGIDAKKKKESKGSFSKHPKQPSKNPLYKGVDKDDCGEILVPEIENVGTEKISKDLQKKLTFITSRVDPEELEFIQNCSPSPISVVANRYRPHPVMFELKNLYKNQILHDPRYAKGNILDVGTSIDMKKYGKRVIHGCENSKDVRLVSKLQNWPVKFRTKSDEVTTKGFRFCTCDAAECKHHLSSFATFFHSIYYNSPAKVAEILNNTIQKRGVALVHKFDESIGELYNVSGTAEAVYRTQGNTVVMHARGNNHSYSHNRTSWIHDGYAFHAIVDTRKVTLTWTIDHLPCGQSFIVHFNLLDGHKEFSHVPNTEFAHLKEQLTTLIAKKVVTVIGDQFQWSTYNGDVVIPHKVLWKGLRYSYGTSQNSTVKKKLSNIMMTAVKNEKLTEPEKFKISLALPVVVQSLLELSRAALRPPTITEKLSMSWNNYLLTETWSSVLMNAMKKHKIMVILISIILITCLWIFKSAYTYIACVLVVLYLSKVGLTKTLIIGILLLLVFIPLVKPDDSARNLIKRKMLYDSLVYDRITLEECISLEGEPFTIPKIRCWKNDIIELNKDVRVKKVETIPNKLEQDSSVVVGPVFSTVYPGTYSSDQINVEKSLYYRVQVKNPEPEKGFWSKIAQNFEKEHMMIWWDGEFRWKGKGEFVELVEFATYEDFVKRFPKTKRDRINKAKEMVENGEISKVHFNFTGFVKQEKGNIMGKDEFEPQKPRMIYGIDWFTKAIAGLWFLNYTKVVKALFSINSFIWYVSGATTDNFSLWYNQTSQLLGSSITYLVSDFSRFDITQGIEIIKNNTRRYRQAGFMDLPWAKHILHALEHTKLYCRGLIATYLGGIKSGSMDTSVANTTTVAILFGSFFQRFKGYLENVRIATLGDDNFTMINTEWLIKTFKTAELMKEQLSVWILRAGLIVKMRITREIMEAEFLSMRFYPVKDGFAVGKKPGRTMVRCGHLMKRNHTEEEFKGLLKATLISYLPTSNHVPFLRKYVKIVLEHLKDVKEVKPDFEYEDKYILGNLSVANEETWVSFHEVYGLTQEDEEKFGEKLEACINKLGLACYLDCHSVDTLVQVEKDLDL